MDNQNNNKPIYLNDEELDGVTGGAVYVNGNTGKVAFTTIGNVYVYKNCTIDDIRALSKTFAGKFATDAEFDTAVETAMKEKGWI